MNIFFSALFIRIILRHFPIFFCEMGPKGGPRLQEEQESRRTIYKMNLSFLPSHLEEKKERIHLAGKDKENRVRPQSEYFNCEEQQMGWGFQK